MNPWERTLGGQKCQVNDESTRLERIKHSANPDWLRAVIAHPDNQKSVQQAAERQLRKIQSRPAFACAAP